MKVPYDQIHTIEELEQLQGKPGRLASNKVIHYLDENCRKFIQHSPFAVISTADREGNCDSSPRGDSPGFAKILNEHTFVLPERIGNRRMDSLRNLLENPKIGLIFIIPGLDETLRINGKAAIVKDRDLLSSLEANGHIPNLAIHIEVEECYIHCAKAFKRSKLWVADKWPDLSNLPVPAKMIAAHVKLDDIDETSVQASLDESYRKRLY